MSATPPNQAPDDRLARAEEALRRLAVPEGPTDDALARALAAARAAEGRAGRPTWSRRRVIMSTLKIAAAVAVAGSLFYAARPPRASATAFEETAQKLHDARTIVYTIQTIIEGAPAEAGPMRSRLYYRAPKLARIEAEAQGSSAVTILDGTARRMVILEPARKSAMVLEDVDPPDDFAARTVDELRDLPGKEARPVGRERIGEVEAEGYRVDRIPGAAMVAWVDPRTRLPIRIDVTQRVADKEARLTLSDFRLDPPLDDALFRVDPPEGYAVQRMNGAVIFDRPEAVAARVLRLYAEKNGGAFPPKLDAIDAYKALFPAPPAGAKKGAAPPQIDPKAITLIVSITRVVGLRNEVRDLTYRPEGVKLGDAGKPLLWFRPRDSARYRVVFGDLHIEEAEAAPRP